MNKDIKEKESTLVDSWRTALKEFADKNYMKLEEPGEFLIKLGICSHKESGEQ